MGLNMLKMAQNVTQTRMMSMTNKPATTRLVSVEIKADQSLLSPQDKKVVSLLEDASRVIDILFLNQARQNLQAQGGRFDKEIPLNFYPENFSKEEMEAHLDAYPEDRGQLLSPFSVVSRKDTGELVAEPFSEFYRAEMGRVADLLQRAAMLSKNKTFKQFLMLRAQAFRTNEYRESDIAWVHVKGAPIEFTVGPFENYLDTFYGLKRDFEAVLGLVCVEETEKAALFQDEVTLFDAYLGEKYGYEPQVSLTPMIVINQIRAAGSCHYGYVPMAYNLPNDPDIHAEVGSKKIFVKNTMQAKFDLLTRPIARNLLKAEDVRLLDFDIFLKFVIGHESAHGLSFRFEGKDFGPTSSGVEECKADVFGMQFMYFLSQKGLLEKTAADSAVMHNLIDSFRAVRFGVKEAHSIGSIIQLNWFVHHKAVRISESGLDFYPAAYESCVTSLGDELYALAYAKDVDKVERFISKWVHVGDNVSQLIARLAAVPVDIDPIFT